MSYGICIPSTLPATRTGVSMHVHICRDVETTAHEPLKFLLPTGELVANQTGALLITLGIILTNLYPIREHVDPHTGELLVKIGRKLTGA